MEISAEILSTKELSSKPWDKATFVKRECKFDGKKPKFCLFHPTPIPPHQLFIRFLTLILRTFTISPKVRCRIFVTPLARINASHSSRRHPFVSETIWIHLPVQYIVEIHRGVFKLYLLHLIRPNAALIYWKIIPIMVLRKEYICKAGTAWHRVAFLVARIKAVHGIRAVLHSLRTFLCSDGVGMVCLAINDINRISWYRIGEITFFQAWKYCRNGDVRQRKRDYWTAPRNLLPWWRAQRVTSAAVGKRRCRSFIPSKGCSPDLEHVLC